MNKHARRHLLAVVDRASAPLLRVSLPEASSTRNEALSDAINSLGVSTSIILPPSVEIEFIKPKGAPRVVAGKGRRRRGIQVDPPKRLPPLFTLPEGEPAPGSWSNIVPATPKGARTIGAMLGVPPS